MHSPIHTRTPITAARRMALAHYLWATFGGLMITEEEKVARSRRIALVLLSICAAALLWWMLGAYTTHGRSHYRPISSHDSLAAIVAPPR